MKSVFILLLICLSLATYSQGIIIFDHEKKQAQLYGDISAETIIQTLSTVEYPEIQKYDIVPVYPVPFMNPGQSVHYLRFTARNLFLATSKGGNLELWGKWKVFEFLQEVNKFDFDRKNTRIKPTWKSTMIKVKSKK